MAKAPYALFEVFGIELEYMLVSTEDLSIEPCVDELLKKVAGEYTTDYVENGIGWANELVLHVMEMRTDEPASSLKNVAQMFQDSIRKANRLAESLGAKLMPTSMHPWMNPSKDTKLWPHEYAEVYQQFDRIFDCHRHGWANLQSCQLNLPFANDEEFAKLHSAIRILLPIMPALASSSPIMEEKTTNFVNNRLEVYKSNAIKVPLVAGDCIPEPFFTKKDYEEQLLQSIYEQVKPFDLENVLQHEWLNARGAIARFDRSAIEIRVLDIQEHPGVDIAICFAIAKTLKHLVEENYAPSESFKAFPVSSLKKIMNEHIQSADETIISDKNYLRIFGITENKISAKELWHFLIHESAPSTIEPGKQSLDILDVLLKEGVLSRRILKAVGDDLSRQSLTEVYSELCQCLHDGKMFHA